MSSMGATADFPELIRAAFVTPTKNKNRIHGVRLFIRGKPWVLTVDDQLLFKRNSARSTEYVLFANPNIGKTAFWVPILEKAYAKALGSYENIEGGFFEGGISALLGAPTFGYPIAEIGQPGGRTQTAMFAMLKAGFDAGYVIGVGTNGDGDDSVKNSCGIASSHAYSVLALFEMNVSGTNVPMVMIRNPWGTGTYTGPYNPSSLSW